MNSWCSFTVYIDIQTWFHSLVIFWLENFEGFKLKILIKTYYVQIGGSSQSCQSSWNLKPWFVDQTARNSADLATIHVYVTCLFVCLLRWDLKLLFVDQIAHNSADCALHKCSCFLGFSFALFVFCSLRWDLKSLFVVIPSSLLCLC